MCPTTQFSISPFRNVIAVASGKGGVGKSTVAANLAVALAAQGQAVGLLDADIHGPSLPTMFHAQDEHPCLTSVGDRELVEPVLRHGVKLLSIGFFIDPNDALIWRGAMASNALKQLITDANWGRLDFFIIDLPPGTSDLHITLIHTLRLSGALIVTTPQEIALTDARKAIAMFQNPKVLVPVIGLIENMAWFTPAELPHARYFLFGKGGGLRLAQQFQLPLLAQIPLVQSICQSGDDGAPAALQADSPVAQAFASLAQALITSVAPAS
jgi:ATP-binding protein involved in chromosome partitioning